MVQLAKRSGEFFKGGGGFPVTTVPMPQKGVALVMNQPKQAWMHELSRHVLGLITHHIALHMVQQRIGCPVLQWLDHEQWDGTQSKNTESGDKCG